MSYPTARKLICTFIFSFAIMLACTPVWAGMSLPPFDPDTLPQTPDYAKDASWLALPANPNQYAVDVFWVYPTILHDESNWLMDISSPELKAAAQNSIVRQASVFTGQANLYAPLYRQMNMAALALSEDEISTIGGYGKQDVERAFHYYLEHYNNGRPFILAAHSQGSDTLTSLVVRKWGSLGVEKQLVAAYLIGWSITQDDLKQNNSLKMCGSAQETNCFISYNTVASGRQSVAPTISKGAVVVNPLSWKIDTAKAPANLNLGARFFNKDGSSQTLPYFTSAQAQDYGLIVIPIDSSLVDSDSATFPKGVYHPFDYSLFHENLKANVAQRIQAFLTNIQ